MLRRTVCLLGLVVGLVGCSDTSDPETTSDERQDLPIGEILDPPSDGAWGFATECKPIPEVEPLNDPKIVVSLDGLTLRLYDAAGDYDRVFPVGVGAIENGESLTPPSTQFSAGTYYTRTDEAPTFDGPTPDQAKWGWNQQCRVWWTGEDGEKIPVFAGLPFIRLAGNPLSSSYAFHGPVDNYTNPSGGTLRRGYVSHGCVRMAAADIVEVYGRIEGKRAEVLIQKPVERTESGAPIDVDPWFLSECNSDAECAYDGGVCVLNEYNGPGYCSKACTTYCPDRAGHATSFCAKDADTGEGFCTIKADTVRNNDCGRYQGFSKHLGVPRPDGSAVADVCLPGTRGETGDRCLSDDECLGICVPLQGGPGGVCTAACTRFCDDTPNVKTFCIDAPDSIPVYGGMCVAKCFNDDHCQAGMHCAVTGRNNESSVTASVCVPN
ncbi:MAG: L,D-transpeptidase [bacterium]